VADIPIPKGKLRKEKHNTFIFEDMRVFKSEDAKV
jgi:hypothetical protein